ncbi:hypothetical protein APHAL10511_002347 [Amanita phalloides]|nr:hypothetical protein APHAL10511_002347 [Amanita phalloides]
MRWWEYLSHFNFKIEYLKGEKNKVADCLSPYFSSDGLEEAQDESAYVKADSRLDPEGDDLTITHNAEILGMTTRIIPREREVHDNIEPRSIKVIQLTENLEGDKQDIPKLDLQNKPLRYAFKAMLENYKNDKFFAEIWSNSDRF